MALRSWRQRVGGWRPGVVRGKPDVPAAGRTAFVLLGGGARGAAQAGALSVLLARGVTPDIMIGISAGAWNGAYLAENPTEAQALELERLWLATTSQEVMGRHRVSVVLRALAFHSSLYGGDGLRRVAMRHLADKTFADLRVPLRIMATNLSDGRAKLLEQGPLLQAVLASSAMPGIFPPVVVGESVLVDGGVVEWDGCLAALDAGATRVVLVGCGYRLPSATRVRSFHHVLERSWEVGIHASFERTVFALRAAGVEVLPILPELEAGSMLDFDRAPHFIHAGRVAAERALAASLAPRLPAAVAARRGA